MNGIPRWGGGERKEEHFLKEEVFFKVYRFKLKYFVFEEELEEKKKNPNNLRL